MDQKKHTSGSRKILSIIKFFQKDGKKSMTKWLNRMNKYKKIILPILEKEDITL